MATPTINGTPVAGSSTPGTTSYAVALPTGVAAGEVVILLAARYVDGLTTTDTGWSKVEEFSGGSGIGKVAVFTLAASGGETSVTLTGGGSYNSNKETHVCFRIGGQHATYYYAGTSASGSSNTPDPPSVTPAPGSDDYLILAMMGCDGRAGYNTPPSGYSIVGSVNGGDYNNNTIAVASLGVSGTTANPGTFGISGIRAWGAQTVAIRPAAGGGGGGGGGAYNYRRRRSTTTGGRGL